MDEIRSPGLSLAVCPALCAALAHLLSLRAAFSLLPTVGEAKSALSSRVTLSASLHPKALYAPPRAEKRLIFGHETAFWHESGSFRRRVDPVEIADLGFRYEGTRFWSEGAQSLCQNAVSWPKIGQLSACSVRVTTSLGLQMSASARGRACSLRWGKPDKGMPLGAGEGRSRERAKRGDRVGAGGGVIERLLLRGCRLGAKDDCARG